MEMKNENEGTKVNETIPEEMSKPEENSEANKPADPVDRISSLPDQVAQLILSLLPEKDAARSTVWSKRWDRLHHSSPILDFDERRFQGAGYANCRRKFLYHIEKALLKRGNLTQVKELQVVSAMSFDDDLEEILMRLLGMAVRDKVPEIKLDINKNSHPRDDFTICFVLPEVIFSSGSSLASLTLANVGFGRYSEINLLYLKALTLTSVRISDIMLSRIIAGCPIVENLILEACKGLRILRFSNRRLKDIIISCCLGLKAFEINAPALGSFRFNGYHHTNFSEDDTNRHSMCCTEISKFNMSTGENSTHSHLKSVTLLYTKIGEKVFNEMLSSNPNIERLAVKSSIIEKIPNLLLEYLKVLEVKNCEVSQPVGVCAPSLESVTLCTGDFNIWPKGNGYRVMKTLTLKEVTGLKSDSLEKFLSCCPVIESLTIASCKLLTHIKLENSRLRSLEIEGCNLLSGGEICAPRLVYFKYVGHLVEFEQMITSSELKAEIKLTKPDDKVVDDLFPMKVKNLLRNLGQARVLELNSAKIEYVIISEDVQTGFPPIYFLSHVTVKTSSLRNFSHIDLVLGVLRISLCQKVLLITSGDTGIDLKFQTVPEGDELELLDEWDSHDCLNHLTEVKIKNCDGSYKDLELIKYLLGKATTLENMSILFTTIRPSERGVAPPTVHNIIDYIKKFPKASPSAELVFIN